LTLEVVEPLGHTGTLRLQHFVCKYKGSRKVLRLVKEESLRFLLGDSCGFPLKTGPEAKSEKKRKKLFPLLARRVKDYFKIRKFKSKKKPQKVLSRKERKRFWFDVLRHAL
jgi:hypothetical protein